MEESYESFAGVYDLFMDNIDYPAWCTYLTGILKEYGIEDGLIAELGCGTGSMTELLAAEGYDMIGIDNSPDMLEVAGEVGICRILVDRMFSDFQRTCNRY